MKLLCILYADSNRQRFARAVDDGETVSPVRWTPPQETNSCASLRCSVRCCTALTLL